MSEDTQMCFVTTRTRARCGGGRMYVDRALIAGVCCWLALRAADKISECSGGLRM